MAPSALNNGSDTALLARRDCGVSFDLADHQPVFGCAIYPPAQLFGSLVRPACRTMRTITFPSIP